MKILIVRSVKKPRGVADLELDEIHTVMLEEPERSSCLAIGNRTPAHEELHVVVFLDHLPDAEDGELSLHILESNVKIRPLRRGLHNAPALVHELLPAGGGG